MRPHMVVQWGLWGLVCLMFVGWPVVRAAEDVGLAIKSVVPAPMAPAAVARINPDGTRGAWMAYAGEGDPTNLGEARPIWDTWTQCVYDIPPGSRQFCPGECEGRWFFMPGPVCTHAMGGDLPDDPPATATSMTFAWCVERSMEVLEIEFLIYEVFDGEDCTDSGSGFVDGVLFHFEDPEAGCYYAEVDLRTHGMEMETPRGGRIGIQTIYWRSRDNREYSNEMSPALWFTKTGWEHVIGGQDTKWFDDRQNPDCRLDADDCITGEKPCPFNEYGLIQSLLLEGGETDTCIYRLTRDARAKGRCPRCPRKNELIASDRPCDESPDCPMKLRLRRSPCLEGPNGFCAKIKGKRDRCGTLP